MQDIIKCTEILEERIELKYLKKHRLVKVKSGRGIRTLIRLRCTKI